MQQSTICEFVSILVANFIMLATSPYNCNNNINYKYTSDKADLALFFSTRLLTWTITSLKSRSVCFCQLVSSSSSPLLMNSARRNATQPIAFSSSHLKVWPLYFLHVRTTQAGQYSPPRVGRLDGLDHTVVSRRGNLCLHLETISMVTHHCDVCFPLLTVSNNIHQTVLGSDKQNRL